MVVFESAGVSDVGKKRSGNEDAFFISDQLGFFIVADGMGGHRAGDVASGLVVESIRDYLERTIKKKEIENTVDIDESLSKEANQMQAGISFSNRIVYKLSRDKESYRGMGSTVSFVYFTEHSMISANVGDSPIYLIHNGNIEMLSTPHTVMAEQASIDPVAAEKLGEGFKHMLTRAVGVDERVKADIYEVPFFKNDTLVISSDGLSNKVTPEEILEVTKSHRVDEACQNLVDLANERGGEDNITVVIIKILGVKNSLLKNIFNTIARFFDNFLILPTRKIFN